MKITLATGITQLDTELRDRLSNDLNIDTIEVNYRDFLLKECTETVILSEYLGGSVDISSLILSLKKKNVRVILLLDSAKNPLFYKALKFAVYDILFDESSAEGIKVDAILDLIQNPKTIKDFSKIVASFGDAQENIEEGVEEDSAPVKDSSNVSKKDSTKQKVVIKEVEKIKEIPKYITVNFINKLITVWGNPQFASELAYFASAHTAYSVLLIDLDFTALKTDMYLGLGEYIDTGIEQNLAFNRIFDAIRFNTTSKEVFIKETITVSNKLNVMLSEYMHVNYESFKAYPIKELLDTVHRYFEIVIVNVNSSIHDIYALQALKYSQVNLIPIKADLPTANEYLRYLQVLDASYHVPMSKQKVIAYQHKKNVDMDIAEFKKLFDDCYFRKVSYIEEREKMNSRGDVYAMKMSEQNRQEYENILNELGIAIKPTFLQKFLKKIQSLKKTN